MSALREEIATWPFGGFIDRHLLSGTRSPLDGLAGRIGGDAMNAANAAVDVVVVLFVGVFLAMEPVRSRDGVLLLVPRAHRAAPTEALNVSARALRLWLGGILAEMATIGVMTGIGAWLVGLPTPFALGVIGGLAEIVPYVGPVVSAVPGLLLAMSVGWPTVFWTLVMYLVIHQIEGNLIYPFIQKRAANLPPALTLLSVLVFTVLLGPIGVVLASPLLVVGLTFLKLLYVRRTLGEAVAVAGEPRTDGRIPRIRRGTKSGANGNTSRHDL